LATAACSNGKRVISLIKFIYSRGSTRSRI